MCSTGTFEDSRSEGAIVNFNLLRPDGSFVGYSEVCTYVAGLDRPICLGGRSLTVSVPRYRVRQLFQ